MTTLQRKLNMQKSKSTSDSEKEEPLKRAHLLGNRNAMKETRKVEKGWLNYGFQSKTFRQVKKKNGGNTRKFDLPKCSRRNEILEKGKSICFPCFSKLGSDEKFTFELGDFSEQVIESNDTVEEWYNRTGVSVLRFYFSTTLKSQELKRSITEETLAQVNPLPLPIR